MQHMLVGVGSHYDSDSGIDRYLSSRVFREDGLNEVIVAELSMNCINVGDPVD